MLNIKNVGKIILPVAGAVLTIAASVVNAKNQDARMNETIKQKVAEALADQTKGES